MLTYGFLQNLASLLPDLAEKRNPSMTAILGSAITHIGSLREHRLLASRQLRALNIESDTFRREVNQWRERAGVPAVPEPRRDHLFVHVMTGAASVPTSNPYDEEFEEHLSSVRVEAMSRYQPSPSRPESPFPAPKASGLQSWHSPSSVPSNSPRNSSSSTGNGPRSGNWPYPTVTQAVSYRNSSQSSLDSFSEVESGESVDSSFSSSSRNELEVRSRHLQTHRLILDGLVRDILVCVFPGR